MDVFIMGERNRQTLRNLVINHMKTIIDIDKVLAVQESASAFNILIDDFILSYEHFVSKILDDNEGGD